MIFLIYSLCLQGEVGWDVILMLMMTIRANITFINQLLRNFFWFVRMKMCIYIKDNRRIFFQKKDIMTHNNQSLPHLVKLFKDRKDFFFPMNINIWSRLICNDNIRIFYQSSRYQCPLPFPSWNFWNQLICESRQFELFQKSINSFSMWCISLTKILSLNKSTFNHFSDTNGKILSNCRKLGDISNWIRG